MQPLYRMEGIFTDLEVYEDKLTMTPRGLNGFLVKGLQGTKTILFYSITGIQFREGNLWANGFIQFTIPGGIEARGGVSSAIADENSFVFSGGFGGGGRNEVANEIRDYIETSVLKLKDNRPAAVSPSEEIRKLVSLRDDGILSEVEFQAAKKKLLGI